MPRLTVRPFGASFVIDADDRRVIDVATAGLGRYPNDGGVVGPVHLNVRTVRDADGPSAWPTTSMSTDSHTVELRCGASVLRCDHLSGEAEFAVTPATLATDDELRMFIEAAFWSPLISTRRIRAVHSALVVCNGVGLMLRGESNAGKSTLSYASVRAGMRLVSDDWLYLPAHHEPEVLWGYPWRMWMTHEAAQRFPEIADSPVVPHPGSDRAKIAVVVPPAQRRVRHRVDAVVMLDSGAELSLAPIDPAAAVERFNRSALDSELNSLPAQFVAALLDRPTFVLQRGASPAAAVDELAGLARSLRPTRFSR